MSYIKIKKVDDSMANVKTLQDKVAKATEKVSKCKATIERHQKALAKKITALEKASGRAVDTNDLDSYKWINGVSTHYYWEACDVANKLSDIKGAEKKLAEAERILAGHQDKLGKEVEKQDFISNSVPQVIKDFLNKWKEMAYDWHIRRYDAYVSFKQDLYAKEREAIKECQDLPYRQRQAYMKEKGLDNISKRLAQFGGATVQMMDSYRKEADRLAYLDKMLEEEKQAKTIDLLNRITAVVGDIVDAKGLRVSEKGNLDGVIVGSVANAKIETIGAGGYNIQCFHYRTLVHKI
jgi:hypothetical protein